MSIDFNDFDEETLDQASAWIARLRSDKVSKSDKQDFALWVAQSELNKRAFDEVLLLWQSMGQQQESAEELVSGILKATMANTDVAASNDEGRNNSDRLTTPAPRNLHSNHVAVKKPLINIENWFVAAAASIAVVAVILFYNFQPNDTKSDSYHAIFETRKGELSAFTLPDGSVIELNTDSKVETHYSSQQRHITLEKGEAYFSVASNPSLPFIVDAGAGRITAVGTAFNIYRPGRNTVVTVTEGSVKVADTLNNVSAPDDSQIASKVYEKVLVVGQAIEVDASEGLGEITVGDENASIAWRKQILVFNETELVAALEELNRYLATPVDCSHPSLLTVKPVSGTFNLKDPENTLTAIIDTYSLQVERKAGQIKLMAPIEKI